MALEIFNWLQDVFAYIPVSNRRKMLRQPGQGIDYTDKKYKNLVSRVVSRLHPDRMRLRVTEIIQETPSSKTFRLKRLDGDLPPFRAGQYVNVFVDVDGVLTSRPYSIASPPGSDQLALTVRENPDGFVAPYLLNEVQVDDELETTGPVGNFYYEPLIDGQDLVFLAGGSGITPIFSIICDALQRELPLNIQLLYGSRLTDDVIYGDELTRLAETYPRFSFSQVISEPPPNYEGLSGFLDAKLIGETIGDVTGKTFYICGPGIMHDFCLAALQELGTPTHRIRRELSGPPADVTKEPGWPANISASSIHNVEIEGQDNISALAGESLMNSLERNGVVVPAICRTGACSACRVKLLSGKVFMPAHTCLRGSDREHGYIHSCVAYPLEDLKIMI